MADKKDPKSPATTSYAYDVMLPKWQKIETVLGGTDAMRAAGEAYLPQHSEETDGAYRERLSRSTLLNVVQMTVEAWVGKPFSEPIRIGETVPQQLKDLFSNVDLQGNSLDVFGRNWFRDGLVKGFSHVLVEFPRATPRPDGLPRTLEDDQNDGLRPYLVQVKPENLIFAFAQVIDGVERLTHVRILETTIEQDGFAESVVNRIRQIEPGLVTIFKEVIDPKTKKSKWVEEDSYAYSLNFIPLVTFYADRQEFMVAKPPLEDLTDLNIEHWQSHSDQTSILTVTRFPILAVSGAVSDDELRVGPNQWLNCPDPAGRFYYVEHTGRAIAAGRQQLLDLEETMAEYGATFLKKRPGGASATARALDTAEMTSPLQDMAIRFQASLGQALLYMGNWLGLDTGGFVNVNLEFGLSDGDSVKIASLQDARAGKEISRKRYLQEMIRFGVLGNDFDPIADGKELEGEKDYAAEAAEAAAVSLAKALPAPAPGAGGPGAGAPKPEPAPKVPANPDRPVQ